MLPKKQRRSCEELVQQSFCLNEFTPNDLGERFAIWWSQEFSSWKNHQLVAYFMVYFLKNNMTTDNHYV